MKRGGWVDKFGIATLALLGAVVVFGYATFVGPRWLVWFAVLMVAAVADLVYRVRKHDQLLRKIADLDVNIDRWHASWTHRRAS